MFISSLFTLTSEYGFETRVSELQAMPLQTLPYQCFSFYYMHRARVKQRTVQSCLVSQNKTMYDCTDGITLRVTLKPLHDSSLDRKFLAYGSEASAATAKIQV